MMDVQVFIFDDRYSVPTLHLASVFSLDCARVLAQQMLAESVHHLAIEVYEAERLIVELGHSSVADAQQA